MSGKKEAILTAATQAFAAHGFDGASTSAIARSAGVTQPLVYHHFASKDALWRAVLDALFAQMAERLLEAQTPEVSGGLEDQLRAMLRVFVLYVGENAALARIMAFETFVASPRFYYVFDEHIAPLISGVRGLLGQAQDEGVIRRDIDLILLRNIIVGSSTYLVLSAEGSRRLDGVDPDDPEVLVRYADLVTRVLFDGITT